jgi:hypothetical protein
VRVVVRVSPTAAAQLQAGADAAGGATAALLRLVGELGGDLHPQHPGVADPSLMRWFVLDGPGDRRAADAAAAALREHPEVESAYAKPADELPG